MNWNDLFPVKLERHLKLKRKVDDAYTLCATTQDYSIWDFYGRRVALITYDKFIHAIEDNVTDFSKVHMDDLVDKFPFRSVYIAFEGNPPSETFQGLFLHLESFINRDEIHTVGFSFIPKNLDIRNCLSIDREPDYYYSVGIRSINNGSLMCRNKNMQQYMQLLEATIQGKPSKIGIQGHNMLKLLYHMMANPFNLFYRILPEPSINVL